MKDYIAVKNLVFKPDLKYEILIAMHVLVDPSHHQHAHEWACKTLGNLSSQTKADIFSLVENTVSEWQLSNSIKDCDTQNDIERLLSYIRKEDIVSFFKQEGLYVQEDFPLFFASIVERFWNETFNKDYAEKYYPILMEDVREKVNQLKDTNLMEFMENWTGREFKEKKNLVFYPSYFIMPHAHGFNAKEGYVTVYQVQGEDVIGNAIHELLHQLLSDWHKRPGMKELVDKFGKSTKFKGEWEKHGKSYSYPEGWLEESIIASYSPFLYAKFTGIDTNRPWGFFTDIQKDIFHAIIAGYNPDKYRSFDDFLIKFLAEYDVNT
ncbi:hypothetical protein FJZ33_12310 [Candidatus Poribacteria bacterium]|nr:hypothetical protein [Candidatus Poribacteria bacterium]